MERDELQDFVARDVQEGRRVRRGLSWHRALLSTATCVAIVWVVSDFTDEIAYHFSGADIVDLGAIESLDPARLPPIDAYVRLTGVVGNKAATVAGLRPGSLRRGPVQVRQLLGSSVFVEFDQESRIDDFQPFTQTTLEGRLADFSSKSELGAVRDYFAQRFLLVVPETGRLLIVDERPGTLWRYPVALGIALLLVATSVFFLIRSARTVVVEHDA